MTPLKRLYNLLALDKRDLTQLFIYAIIAGLISLSLPLGIQAIINFIQSGRVSVSWIVLVVLVAFGVALVGLVVLMQLRITENLQQKIFVRSSFEFAARFPKIKFVELYNNYPPELANRFFDTLTIQKGVSKLLLDFSAALLQIAFGIILLSLYHPFFIVFGLLLFFLLYFIFKYSFKNGVETSLQESKYKYKVASWIQEIARNNYSFRNEHNFQYALEKNDELVESYLSYREYHFNVIQRQFTHLIIFKVIITASLLSVGGYLVLSQRMNIGQFVAAEIIILLVINSVEKIIVGLETLYDVLTAVEKIGVITDMNLEDESKFDVRSSFTDITLETDNLQFNFPDSTDRILKSISLKIEQGEKILIDGPNGSGKTTLIRLLSGLMQPTTGTFFINDDTFQKINLKQYRSQIATIIRGETLFEGTIFENIAFNDEKISPEDLRWAIDAVKLTKLIKTLPEGLQTKVFPEGRQLSSSDAQKILLARSIIRKPKVLFYEDPTNAMDENLANEIIDFITSDKNNWTLVVSSANPYWDIKCNRKIAMQAGRVILDTKK
jgi:ABC-type bacteriocin/lantibiotic exporter with double-glycine peptidase domain